MSLPLNRRGALSRADLVAALAQADGETPDATTLCLAEALRLEWVQPQAKPRKRGPPKPPKLAPQPESSAPKILAVPLQETLFWQVQAVEFFTEPAPPPPPPVIPPYRGWRGKPQQPPKFQPLASWSELAPRLRKVLCGNSEGRAVDLPLTVRLISQGRLLERFPRERRRRWGPTMMLIEDDSRRLIPYRADRCVVREVILRLLPDHSLYRALMDEYHEKPEPLDGCDWPPPPGSQVLALGDLGCLAKQGERQRQCWLDIGQELREGDCHAIALFPAPLSRCTPDLAAVWRIVPWERQRPEDGYSLERRAERLLRLVSPAARIEPGLLRSVRLLLPESQADAGTESDVWQHSALSCNSAVAASLIPEQARTLRLALASAMKAGGLGRLASLIKAWHGHLPEEIWFDELLNLAPDAFDTQELRDDQEDAQSYFAAFCDDNPVSADLAMPACDRAWLSRVKARSTGYLWQDRKVGLRLAELALAVDPQAAYLPGIGVRDIPHRDQPERVVRVSQIGEELAFDQEQSAAGSFLAELSTRNGLIEIAPQTGSVFETASVSNNFWETGEPPSWASDWGWDEYGAWVEFSVTAKAQEIHDDSSYLNDDDSSSQYDRNIGYEKQVKITQKMRWIEPGSFLMGSPKTEAERYDDEGPQHEVNLQQGYWLFDTACTQALWQAVMGKNPSHFKDDNKPVEQVSWNDAQQFIRALNQCLPGLELSLPSEAQWEYACRAGATTPFSFGGNITPEQVNYNGEYPYAGGKQGLYRQETVPVKSLPANPWGLYEMHGNVREWVRDAWHDSYQGAPTDGGVWESADAGAGRVLRGGSWGHNARNCRSASRNRFSAVNRHYSIGFRCARVQGREPGKPAAGRAGQTRSGASQSAWSRPAGDDRSHAPRGNAAEGAPRLGPQSGQSDVPTQSVGTMTNEKPLSPEGRGVGVRGEAFTTQLLRLDTTPKATAPLPQAKSFAILTDRERLVVRQTQQPEWADAMGRDRFGLWADIAVESKQGEPVIQRLRWIPPGRFMMGSPTDEPGRYDDEGPQHLVTISQGYWLFDTPCTQALWEAVMHDNPSEFNSPRRPVEQVSWNTVQTFLQRINEKCQGLDLALPNEAQWEYACRAGTNTALYTGPIEIIGERNAPALDGIAWYGGNSGVGFDLPEGYDSSDWKEMQYPNPKSGTREVGQKRPNPWGLYDMLGNVLEWVEDPWHSSYEGAPTDGSAWESADAGAGRVLRGGSWLGHARSCRSAYRLRYSTGFRVYIIGFRCARVQS